MSEERKIEFVVEHRYAHEDGGVRVEEVPMFGTITQDEGGGDRMVMTRQNNGDVMYQCEMEGHTLIGTKDYIAISSHGGWGKSTKLEDALSNCLDQSCLTKAKVRQLDTLRGFRVCQSIEGTGWVSQYGQVGGFMLREVPASLWLPALWDLVKPKLKKG